MAGLGGLALLGSPANAETSDPRALAALERAATAAHALSYAGTQYVSSYSPSGSSSVVLTVEHTGGQGSVVTVASSSSPRRSVYASDAPLPGRSDLTVAGVDGAALRLLQQTYDLELEGTACVVARRQDGKPAARFWLDPATGLVVRREVYGGDGQVVRASAFVDLRLRGARTTAVASRSLVAEVGERRLELSELAPLSSAGWTVPRVLPGQLVLYDARMQEAGDDTVVHLGYSDGLSTVSLFQQRGRLDKDAVHGWRHDKVDGADVWWDSSAVPTRAVWWADGRVWTVVADASTETVRAVVTQLPHDKIPHRGFWGRIAHGLAKLFSWLNPFD
jgi:sigma-E factor negative regulatory protein RseB